MQVTFPRAPPGHQHGGDPGAFKGKKNVTEGKKARVRERERDRQTEKDKTDRGRQREDVKMCGCENVKMWRTEGAREREREKVPGCQNVKCGCEDEKTWNCEEVEMWRCEDVRMWRCDDVRIGKCEYVKMWRRGDVTMTTKTVMMIWKFEDDKMWTAIIYGKPDHPATLFSAAECFKSMWVGRDGWGGKNLSYIGEVNLRFHPRMLGLQDPEIYEPKQKKHSEPTPALVCEGRKRPGQLFWPIQQTHCKIEMNIASNFSQMLNNDKKHTLQNIAHRRLTWAPFQGNRFFSSITYGLWHLVSHSVTHQNVKN